MIIKMTRFKIEWMLLLFLKIISGILSATHWMVTESGKIQPQLDSIINIRRPDDLISFLEQEKRRDDVEIFYKKMMARKASIERQWSGIDTAADIEDKVYSTDENCLLAKKLLTDIDLFTSVATDGLYREGISLKDYSLDDIPDNEEKLVPDCKKTFSLDFSIYTFEHFTAMRNRKNLVQTREESLIKDLPFGTNLNKLGYQIAQGLLCNNTSWLYLNLAAIYWRIKGDAYNALECARRSIITAPRQFRDIPLLTTGGIMHAAKHSAEAAIVLHTAIDYAPTQSQQHFVLGNVYATLGDYNRSVACYENSLKLDSNMDQARDAKHAILCHQKLENTLTSLLNRLQNILAELRAFESEQNEWFKLQERIMWEEVHSPLLNLGKDLQKKSLTSTFANRGQSCSQRGSSDTSVLSCDNVSDRQALVNNLQIEISVGLQLLSNLDILAKRINEQVELSDIMLGTKDQISKTIESIGEKKNVFFTVFMDPTERPKYYNLKIEKSSKEFESQYWPEESQCESFSSSISHPKDYVPVYLPPENKGFAVPLFLNELIEWEERKLQLIHWKSPTCDTPRSYNEKYITQSLLKASESYNEPDVSLSPFLYSLVEDAEIAEIGQRILIATESKVAAHWVLSVLASLYWRVVGKPKKALDCLQLALESVPTKFRDVPLISIASISQKVNLIDDALLITEEALNVNPVEPVTNFLYGSLLHIKGNDSGAIHYLKQTLRVDLHLMNGQALNMLTLLSCRIKFGTPEEETPS